MKYVEKVSAVASTLSQDLKNVRFSFSEGQLSCGRQLKQTANRISRCPLRAQKAQVLLNAEEQFLEKSESPSAENKTTGTRLRN